MTHTMPCVYSILLFSVDLRENPMFAGVKQGSLVADQHELFKELDLGTHVDQAVVDPAVHHGIPLGFTDAQLGVERDHLDDDRWLGPVEESHGQAV